MAEMTEKLVTSDEMSNTPEEKMGPRVGVSITLEGAQKVVSQHLPGVRCVTLRYVHRGFNNRTYILELSDGSQVVLRLGGRFWDYWKTVNEVACLTLVKNRCSNVPVPKILFYSCDKSLIGSEYICMELMPGTPLDDLWSSMNDEQRRHVLDRLATCLASIKKVTFDKIGNLAFENPDLGILPKVDDIYVHCVLELNRLGPFKTYREFLKAHFEESLTHIMEHPFFESLRYLEPRIRSLISHYMSEDVQIPTAALQEVEESLQRAIRSDSPIVLSHYDLEPRNILVDKDNHDITAILDWEFSGAFPADEDWFVGFEFIRANSSENIYNSSEMKDCRVDSTPKSEEPELAEQRQYFFKKLQDLNVFNPQSSMAENDFHEHKARLYLLKENIAPWHLRYSGCITIPGDAYSLRTESEMIMVNILEKYKF